MGVIMVSSITYALKGQEVLSKNAIRSYVERDTALMKTHGCGYGLRVNNDIIKAKNILIKSGIKVIDVIEKR